MSLSRNQENPTDKDESKLDTSTLAPAYKIIHLPDTKQSVSSKPGAPKSRAKECLKFFRDASMAMPPAARSAHAVEKVKRKDKVRFFKHNKTNSLMSELEAAVWAIYHINAPHHVPAKANAHFNSDGDFVGVSLQEIPNFVSTMDNPLEEKDLQNRDIIKGLATILTLSYILEEDDLHRGNMSKHGLRIDFDMSVWPVLGNFKEGSMIDWMYRPRDQERFCITENDIDNFPDIKDAKPFYWPTIPQQIITEGARKVLSNLIPISRNAFPTKENSLFKKLKDDPDFQYVKFKTMLKFLLIPTEQYAKLISQHIRPDLFYQETQNQSGNVCDVLTQHLDTRKWELRKTLVNMPSFRKFMFSHGKEVSREILQEFTEYNRDIRARERAKRIKNLKRDTGLLYEQLIHLEEIKRNYNSIFGEAKKNACQPSINRRV